MEIIYKTGDLLTLTDVPVIAHQVNCRGKMGAGIAKQIRQRWPFIYKAYTDRCNRAKNSKKSPLGTVQGIKISSSNIKYIFNVFSQDNVASKTSEAPFDNDRYTDYDALKKALGEVKTIMAHYSFTSLGIPFNFGCGLANGDWTTVEGIFRDSFQDTDITLYIFKLEE